MGEINERIAALEKRVEEFETLLRETVIPAAASYGARIEAIESKAGLAGKVPESEVADAVPDPKPDDEAPLG